MKKLLLLLLGSALFIFVHFSFAQDTPVYPNVIKTPLAFEITKPLRDNPVVEEQWFDIKEFYMNNQHDREINPNITPPDFNNMPVDPNEQTKSGWIQSGKATLQNFAGQNSGSYPPDARCRRRGHDAWLQLPAAGTDTRSGIYDG